MLIFLFFSISFLYVGGVGYLAWYWKKIKRPESSKATEREEKMMSVVVVVRNEEGKIEELMRDIAAQTYKRSCFEVLVVDDHSEDRTCSQVAALAAELPFKLRLLQLGVATGKKAGLEIGVRAAAGEIIAVTDGDCRLPEAWLEKIAAICTDREAFFVAGPVTYINEAGLFESLQTIEFASLVGAGAAMLQAGKPGMCNAANMAFSKDVYMQVLESREDANIPSGDDEFLLQAIFKQFPEKVFYLKDPAAVVCTRGHQNWQNFYQQRKRWAGKWRMHRKFSIMFTALALYFLQAGWVISSISVLYALSFPYFFAGVLLKFGVEFLFLQSVLRSFGKSLPLFPFLLLQLVYPFYVLFFGIAVNFGQFTWKGRTYN